MNRCWSQRWHGYPFLAITVAGLWLWPVQQGRPMGLKPAEIPAGEFRMGTLDGTKEERPVHAVWVDTFVIDPAEVTNRDYEAFRPKHRRSLLSSCDQCPVTLVTWFEADAYCRNRGERLPTEAEWEKVARGPEGWNYSFGQQLDPGLGRFGKQFQTGAVEVFSFRPNGYGAYQMSGNVWEWTTDWFGRYPKGPVKNPKGPATGFQKVVRGGSWYNPAYFVHVGMRFKLRPEMKINSVGFRCAHDIF